MNRIMTTITEQWINNIATALTRERELCSGALFLADVEHRLTRLVIALLTDTDDYYSTP